MLPCFNLRDLSIFRKQQLQQALNKHYKKGLSMHEHSPSITSLAFYTSQAYAKYNRKPRLLINSHDTSKSRHRYQQQIQRKLDLEAFLGKALEITKKRQVRIP